MRWLLLLAVLLLAAVAAVSAARAQDQIQICHATGNPQAPYQALSLDHESALAHLDHEDDLIPAPADGCPATEVVLPEDTPVPTTTPEYAVPTPTATPRPPARRRPRRDGDRDRRRDDDERGGVGGAGGAGGDGSGRAELSGTPPQSYVTSADMRDLPMTGAEMWLIAGAGIGLLLCGVGVRLRLSP